MAKKQQIPTKTGSSKIASATKPAIVNSNGSKFTQIRQWQLLILFAFAFMLYGNTIGFDYTLDDAIVINQNQFTKKGLAGVGDILMKDTFHGFFGENKQLVSGGRYRPLSVVTFAIEYAFFGENPAVSHFINILLYGLTGILLFLFLLQLFPNSDHEATWLNIPFVTSLLFIAHPLHTEVVANIKGRDEIMCFLGLLGALILLWNHIKTGSVLALASGLICFFLALLSKENAITFLAVIPVALYFFTTEKTKRIIFLTIPFVVLAAVFWMLRGHFTGGSVTMEVKEVLNNPFVFMSTSEKYATIIYTLGKYLWLLVLPTTLVHDYYYSQIPTMHWTDISVIISIALYVSLALIAIRGIKAKQIAAFNAAFYLITISIVSNLLFPIGTTMSERFLYISSLAFCLFIAQYMVSYLKDSKRKYLLPLLGIILLLYSVKTISRNQAWKSNYILFSTDVQTSPNSAKLRNALGGESMAEADRVQDTAQKHLLILQSIDNLKHAVAIYPEYSQAWLLLGNAYFKLNNNLDSALAAYQQAAAVSPGYTDAYYNVGQMYKGKGLKREAIDAFLKLLSYKQNHTAAYFEVGTMLKQLNKADSALAFFNKVAELEPNYPGVYAEMGNIYGQLKGDLKSAAFYLEKAIAQKPDDVSAMENLAISYAMQKDLPNAIRIFNKCLTLNPGNVNVYRNLATAYSQMHDIAMSQRCIARADSIMAATQQHQPD